MFLNSNSILFEKEFGFRHRHFTTHELIEITKKVRQAYNSGQYACGVFLDLQNAFDTVSMIYFSENSTIMVIEA